MISILLRSLLVGFVLVGAAWLVCLWILSTVVGYLMSPALVDAAALRSAEHRRLRVPAIETTPIGESMPA